MNPEAFKLQSTLRQMRNRVIGLWQIQVWYCIFKICSHRLYCSCTGPRNRNWSYLFFQPLLKIDKLLSWGKSLIGFHLVSLSGLVRFFDYHQIFYKKKKIHILNKNSFIIVGIHHISSSIMTWVICGYIQTQYATRNYWKKNISTS